MGNASNSSSVSGIGLSGAVFIVFLVLKLVGTISWSWWWVTSPLWIPLGVFLFIVLVIFICGFIAALLERRRR